MEKNPEICREPKRRMRGHGLQSLFVLGAAMVLVLTAGVNFTCARSKGNSTANTNKSSGAPELLGDSTLTISPSTVPELFEDSTLSKSDNSTANIDNHSVVSEFFGDSTLTIISSNRPNGYLVKFFQTKDLTLVNLSRGDSINQYVAIHEIPSSFSVGGLADSDGGAPDSVGTYIREINIPIKKELCLGLFFMDVNFDGEEELVISHPGYNRTYYACFDIVHGEANVAPGILHPMNEAPYNNIISDCGWPFSAGSTEFDYDKKTIHTHESMGISGSVETWCEMVKEYGEPKIQVVREERVDVEHADDGDYIITTTYKRVDGELKKVSSTREKL